MSYFSPVRLRRLRESKRLSLTDVHDATGITRAQLSKIENGLADPRMSTVTSLLSLYGATLSEVESASGEYRTMVEVVTKARDGADRLRSVGLGPSVPDERLSRKAALGGDPELEKQALASRR
jgi:transcriptional regulator with XRE-family HTH domain